MPQQQPYLTSSAASGAVERSLLGVTAQEKRGLPTSRKPRVSAQTKRPLPGLWITNNEEHVPFGWVLDQAGRANEGLLTHQLTV